MEKLNFFKMKNAFIITLLIIMGIFLQSCSKKEVLQVSRENPKMLSFENIVYQKSYKDCNPDSSACTYVRITYDKVKEGVNKDVINNIILDSLYKSLSVWETTYKNFDSITQNFFSQYETLKRDFPETGEQFLEAIGKKDFEDNNVLTYSLTSFTFTGGAHPNTFLLYLNILKNSPHCLSINEIFKSGFENKLNNIIETKFRKQHNLSLSQPLTDAGLFENKISFNSNFAMLGDNIRFYYNPYEIGPYAMGGITIDIPITDLKEILNPDYAKKTQ